MFKKIVLLLLLLGVVITVSYYKTTLETVRTETAYRDGIAQADDQVESLQVLSDSLSRLLDTTASELTELRSALDTVRLAQTDSLRQLIETKDQQLTELSKKKATTSTVLASKKKSTSKRHKEILAYYKKRYKALPTDLSAYERRVALGEIREESADKFRISLAELDKIRKANKLNY